MSALGYYVSVFTVIRVAPPRTAHDAVGDNITHIRFLHPLPAVIFSQAFPSTPPFRLQYCLDCARAECFFFSRLVLAYPGSSVAHIRAINIPAVDHLWPVPASTTVMIEEGSNFTVLQ